MIKTVIFDFDGVLVDSLKVGHEASLEFCKGTGVVGIENVHEFKTKFVKTHVELYQELGMSLETIEKQKPFFKNYSFENQNRISILGNMGEFIKNLSSDYNLAVVSNNYRKLIEAVLRNNNLLDYFSLISCGDDGGSKSERIDKVLNSLGIQKHEAVYVGDMVHDIEQGRKSQIKTIILSTPASWNHKEDLVKHNPDVLIEHPEEILEVIRNGR